MRAFKKMAASAAVILFGTILSVASVAAQTTLEEARRAANTGEYPTAAELYEKVLQEEPNDEEILVEAGEVYMELERYDRARELFARAVEEDSRDAGANRHYALALSRVGEYLQAIEHARKAVDYDDGTLESRLTLARVLISADSLNSADLTLQNANKEFPDAAIVFVVLGDLYFAREIYELAKLQYEDALERDPTLVEPKVKLGRTYRELAKRAVKPERDTLYNQSLRQFNEVTRLDPKNARAWREQGEIFMLAERYQEAGQSFEAYTRLRPEDPNGDIMLATAAYEGRFYPQAIKPLERILTKNDAASTAFQPKAHAMLGKSYYASKDYEKAREAYAVTQDSLMDNEHLQFYASAILLSGGDTTTANQVYEKLLRQDTSNYCKLAMQYGDLLYKQKQYGRMIEVLTDRINACPEESAATPYLFIGLGYYVQKQFDEATDALGRSIAADSTNMQAYYWMMNAYAASERVDTAAMIAEKVVSRFTEPQDSEKRILATAYYFMGSAKFQAKNYKGAISDFSRASEVDPTYVQSYLFSAFSYQYLNDKDGACRNYKQVLKYDPDNKTARENMKKLGC